MRLSIIVEGEGLDLEPLAEILETVAVEKERVLAAWLDVPLDMVPAKVSRQLEQVSEKFTNELYLQVRGWGTWKPEHAPVIQYIRNKMIAFNIPIEALVGLTIEANKIKLILEVYNGPIT